MKVRDLMNPTVASARTDAPLTEAVPLLESARADAVVIVNAAGAPVGIVTASDLLPIERALEPDRVQRPGLAGFLQRLLGGTDVDAEDYRRAHAHRISDVMTTPIRTIGPDALVAEAIDVMQRLRIGQLPVVADGKLVGILGRRELLRRVTAGLGVTRAVVDAPDAELTARLRDAFVHAPWHLTGNVVPIVRDGVIYLTGVTHQAGDIRAAELLAEETAPGHKVVNELVHYPADIYGRGI